MNEKIQQKYCHNYCVKFWVVFDHQNIFIILFCGIVWWKSLISQMHLRWPALAGWNSEEGQEGPQHIVIMELIFFPLSGHGSYLIFVIVQELASGRHEGMNKAEWRQVQTHQLLHIESCWNKKKHELGEAGVGLGC